MVASCGIVLKFVICSLVRTFSGLFPQDLFLSKFSIHCEQTRPKKFCFLAFVVVSLYLLFSSSLPFIWGKN